MTTPNTSRRFDFNAMHAAMQKWIDDGFLPGASAIVMHGGAVVDEAYWGQRDREKNLPMASDTICRIYSNTKVITSVAAMTLFEAGKFELDDPIEKYLPQLRALKVVKPGATDAGDVEDLVSPPTVRQLFCHNAGFSYGWIQESVIDRLVLAADVLSPNIDLAGMIDRLANVPLAYQPGRRFQYSVSTDVLARLVEVWAGARFSDYLKSTILNPLRMDDTDFYVPADKHTRFAANYVPVDPMNPMKPGLTLAPDTLLGGYLEPRTMESGGGGLVGTLRDYTRFIQMIVGNGTAHGARILQPETVAMMHTNQLPAGVGVQIAAWAMPDTVFGLGFAIKTRPASGEPDAAIGEYHWGGIAGTHSWIAPRANIAAIVFTQRLPGFWHPFSHDFKRCVYQAMA